MNLNEAIIELKEHGYICEKTDLNVEDLQEGDKFLLWRAGKYSYRPVGIITLLEPDTDVAKADQGKAWICELQKAVSGPTKYTVGKNIAYTHGTYGDAIVYPCVNWEHTYEMSDETKEISLKFFSGKEVFYKTTQKNKAFKRDKDGEYFIDEDLDKLHQSWWEYTGGNNSITDPRRLERIFAEHPELRKEYEGMKREYYDLHK